MTDTTYSISELAKEFDVTTRAIRLYEESGLLSPEREGNRRVYYEKDRVRLRLTLRGKLIGFTLAEVKICLTSMIPNRLMVKKSRFSICWISWSNAWNPSNYNVKNSNLRLLILRAFASVLEKHSPN